MNIAIPDNLFTRVFVEAGALGATRQTTPASRALRSLKSGEADAAMVPPLDLLDDHEGVVVSGKYGVALEADVSNAYLYFDENDEEFDRLRVGGDVAKHDAILASVVFRELYGVAPAIVVATEIDEGEGHLLIVGDKNYENDRYLRGQNFGEAVNETLSAPYPLLALAARDEETLELVHDRLGDLNARLDNVAREGEWRADYPDAIVEDFLRDLSLVTFEFAEPHRDALTALTRLPFYHGVVKDVPDFKVKL
jgi:hypothetical protein